MKKTISWLLVMFFLFSFACAEGDLTFNGIPWLSDEAATLQMLAEKGLIRKQEIDLSNESFTYLVEDETGFVSPDFVTGSNSVTFSADLNKNAKGRIAGYPVKDLVLTFAYDGDYRLIAVKVEILNATYEELKSKLTKVYGEGAETNTDDGISSIVWKGNNNSAVVLYTQSEGVDYTLMYGRLDAVEILSECMETNRDDVSGL